MSAETSKGIFVKIFSNDRGKSSGELVWTCGNFLMARGWLLIGRLVTPWTSDFRDYVIFLPQISDKVAFGNSSEL